MAPNGTEQAFRAPATDTFDSKKLCTDFIAVYTLNRPAGYKLAAPGALARAKVKLYHGKAPCGRYYENLVRTVSEITKPMGGPAPRKRQNPTYHRHDNKPSTH